MKKWADKYVIGLTGGVCTGKGVVRRMLEHLGACGIDADAIMHRAIANDSPCYEELIQNFGKHILTKDGQVDRIKLDRLVSNDTDSYETLVSIVFPLVEQAVDLFIKRASQKVVVIETAHLLEYGLVSNCDSIWEVSAPPELQLSRLIVGRNLGEIEAQRKIDSEPIRDGDVVSASLVIDNVATFDETWKQVLAAWHENVPHFDTHPLVVSQPAKVSTGPKNLAIRVDNIGKQYKIFGEVNRYQTLREKITETLRSPLKNLLHPTGSESFWALRNISFEVERGLVMGVIGKNGAGKSTLLKILSRVVEPTEGRAEIRGRVGSLLEVGTGFHPELTGRENVYLNGAILGMKRSEIDKKFDEIIAFSEIEQFIDTPVKRYSSGMYMRLAFAVSAHLEPEILIVDEVLAVGDAEFQKKCLGKMSDVAGEGRTVLFVSHNMSAVSRLTKECIVLEHGKLVMRAPSAEAVDYYLSHGFEQSGERTWEESEITADAHPFTPIALRVMNGKGHVVDSVRSVEPTTIEMEYELKEPITGLRVGIYLMSVRGDYVFTSFDTDDPEQFATHTERKAGHYISRCTIPADMLNEGRFTIGVNASVFRVKRYFQDANAVVFNVNPTGAPGMHWVEPRQGVTRPRLEWQINLQA